MTKANDAEDSLALAVSVNVPSGKHARRCALELALPRPRTASRRPRISLMVRQLTTRARKG